MILAAHQPNYLPYIGFFHKAMLSDVFVIVDDVQYEKKGWQNRNKIRTKDGWMWLTVPVTNNHNSKPKVNEVKINSSIDWRTKHWGSIYCNYVRTPFFSSYVPFFCEVYNQQWEHLADLNKVIINYILKQLDLKVKVVYSSDMHLTGHKTRLLIEMCKKLDADAYVSGIGGRAYINPEHFLKENIKLFFQDFHHPVYSQRFRSFIPNLSIVDMLFNLGADHAKELVRKSGGAIAAWS